MIWFYQTTPHDLYDFDCGWNTVLGQRHPGGSTQEAVFKACKNGYVYAMNALTGRCSGTSTRHRRQEPHGERELRGDGNYSATLPWINYPSTQEFEQCPGENGAIESDIAFAYSMIYVATLQLLHLWAGRPGERGRAPRLGVTDLTPDWQQANTTIYAIDASTGTTWSWSYFMPTIPYRGWLTASNGLDLRREPRREHPHPRRHDGQAGLRSLRGPLRYTRARR